MRRNARMAPQSTPFRIVDDGLLNRLSEAQDVSWVNPVDYAQIGKILAHFPGGTTGQLQSEPQPPLGHAGRSTIMIWDHRPRSTTMLVWKKVGRTSCSTRRPPSRSLRNNHGQPAPWRRLREGAADVQRELVCADCLHGFLLETLKAFRAHFSWNLALDDVETARDAERCSSVETSSSTSPTELWRRFLPSAPKAGPGEDLVLRVRPGAPPRSRPS